MDQQKEKKETKKGAEAVSGFFRKAGDFGKKVVGNVSQKAEDISEKAKADSYQRRVEKYRPLFEEEYRSDEFRLPSLLHIVDKATIQKIDVCEGAYGWRELVNDMEILCLSYDFALESGLDFFPSLTSQTIYCVDPHAPSRYINVDNIFSKAHEEKLAELEHIAYVLGAKSCAIELVETEAASSKSSFGLGAKVKGKGASAEQSSVQANARHRSGRTVATFKGSDHPTRPTLKWFAEDSNILNLVEMRCTDSNSLQSRTLELKGSSSATMAQSTARAIDAAVGSLQVKLKTSMEKQMQKENSNMLLYEIEF